MKVVEFNGSPHKEDNTYHANYWDVIHGTVPRDTQKDEERVQIMKTLGKNMAWLMIKEPEKENKVYTNFIRG